LNQVDTANEIIEAIAEICAPVDRQERPTDHDNRSPSSRSTEIGKQFQRIFEGRAASKYPLERQEIGPIYA
jgi:hypothetical protein